MERILNQVNLIIIDYGLELKIFTISFLIGLLILFGEVIYRHRSGETKLSLKETIGILFCLAYTSLLIVIVLTPKTFGIG